MKVHVVPCFGDTAYFRLVFLHPSTKTREQFNVNADYATSYGWSRHVATEALDLLQYGYSFNRKNIRFIHH